MEKISHWPRFFEIEAIVVYSSAARISFWRNELVDTAKIVSENGVLENRYLSRWIV